MGAIRALVVDDSALMRKLLTEVLNADPEIEVVGTAQDAYVARDKIKLLNPDVLTLDVEMPKMDGLTFLKNIMRLRPMPVVMISSLTQKGAEVAMRALDLGAVDFVGKPKVDITQSMEDCADEIRTKVRMAARVPVHLLSGIASHIDTANTLNEEAVKKTSVKKISECVIAIGASTGGTEAIKEVLMRLPPDSPGIVIAQHIPPEFSRSFAERLDRCTRLKVCEAEDGQVIYDGHAYIAPGGRHLEILKKASRYVCHVHKGARVNRHRPSVDVLFDSVAEQAGSKAVGVILSGMGRDGAKGLQLMHSCGAQTVAQDEQTCVVWGMPRAAVEEGGVDTELPLNDIAKKVTAISSAK
ncbi:MAG: chemotaxis response regulator protein-glutamate methylesterase [Pseudomonadales bacterium]